MPGTTQGAARRQLTKKISVNNFVSKESAIRLRKLLTSSYQELNQLFTALFTEQNAALETTKSAAARDRAESAIACMIECAKYGWHYGLNGDMFPSLDQSLRTRCRRCKALGRVAVRAGYDIGKGQHEKIKRAQHLHEAKKAAGT